MKYVPDALIIGYGNSLRMDDAVGLHVARELAAAGYHATHITQLVPELADEIAASSLVVFVDCDLGLPPGEVAIRPVQHETMGFHEACSPHSLMGLARDVYGCNPPAYLVGIGPGSMDFGEGLTPAVASAASAMSSYLAESLADYRGNGSGPMAMPPGQIHSRSAAAQAN